MRTTRSYVAALMPAREGGEPSARAAAWRAMSIGSGGIAPTHASSGGGGGGGGGRGPGGRPPPAVGPSRAMPQPPKPLPARGGEGDVSPLDKRIIAHLQQDGRRPFTQIESALGGSAAAVRGRPR